MLSLKIKNRKKEDNLQEIKTNGEIPVICYGSGKENKMGSVNLKDFIKVWNEVGESSTITLDSTKDKLEALIYEVQNDPVSNSPIHVDFFLVDSNKIVGVTVPIEFIGISPAVKSGLGILVKALHELEIEALPKDLPHNIEVDISKLENLDDQILVKDLALPKEITLITSGDEIIATISALQEEEKEEEKQVDLAAIEVEKKGKKEEEKEA